MKLKSKKLIPYKGPVIDLNVAQTHTYNVENLAVHNSGGGSLVNYVLYITDLDPIEWDLPFSRFLSVYRSGAPDIDCVHENHLIIMADHTVKLAKDVKSNDYVLGGDGKPHKITATYSRKLYDNEAIFDIRVRAEDGTLGHLIVVANHKFVKSDGSLAYARNLVCGDSLMATCKVEVVNIERIHNDFQLYNVVDITVEDDHRFHILPFDVVEEKTRNLYQHTGCYANN